MSTHVETTRREAILVEDAASIRVMGFPILEALPSRSVPYEQVDPFILLHEARLRLSELANVDTRHPHRGFDNIWYVIEGSASTGHSTGPGGAMERARLRKGALLALRTGRGAWHAEALGADEIGEGLADTEFRSVLFWVIRVLVGEGSPVHLGTPGLILDIELPTGGEVTTSVPPEFQGFAYILEGKGNFGANRRPARPAQLVVLGRGEEFTVTDAAKGTRFLLMAAQPYGETPRFNGPFVD